MPKSSSAAATATALEIDIATSLALSRAATRAVSSLSPDARQAMVRALGKEADVHAMQGGPVADLVVALIKAHAQELK